MQNQNSRSYPRGSSSRPRGSTGSILQHMQVRHHNSAPTQGPHLRSQSQHQSPPLSGQCSHQSIPYPIYIHHQETTVSSITTDTFLVASATSPAPFVWNTPRLASRQIHGSPVPASPVHQPNLDENVHGNHETGRDEAHASQEHTENGPQSVAEKRAQSARLVRSIELIFLKVFKQLGEAAIPAIEYDLLGKEWTDFEMGADGRVHLKPEGVHRKTVTLARIGSTTRFVSVCKLLGRIKKLLREETHTNKRDLFYEHVKLYGTQATVDWAINTITLILKVPRRCLNITASSKGLIAGDLVFVSEAGVETNCMMTISGVSVPSDAQEVEIVHSNAKVIFVVEKEASFQQFREDEICWMESCRCIMITVPIAQGKGYPDEATRYFLMKLVEKLKIPVLAITDGDPHGLEIMCMYRYGTKAPHFGNLSLTVPEMRWLGVRPSDIQKYILEIPDEALVGLTESDRNLALDIMDRPYCGPQMRHELQIMLEFGVKLEIENINALGERFFVEHYLREKLDQANWI